MLTFEFPARVTEVFEASAAFVLRAQETFASFRGTSRDKGSALILCSVDVGVVEVPESPSRVLEGVFEQFMLDADCSILVLCLLPGRVELSPGCFKLHVRL